MDDEKARSLHDQLFRLRTATPEERLVAAAEQRTMSLELLRGGLRARFPAASEDEIENRAGEIVFGAETWELMCEARRRSLPRSGPA